MMEIANNPSRAGLPAMNVAINHDPYKLVRSLVGATLLSCVRLAAAQSLCVAPEHTYFSCKLAGIGQTISVCGNIAYGAIRADSWLQFRSRLPGQPIDAWPTDKQESISRFEGNVFGRYDVVDLRFVKDNSLFSIEVAPIGTTEAGVGKGRFEGSFSIQARAKKPVTSGCVGSVRSANYLAFEELNVALRRRDGNTDLMREFFAGRPTSLLAK
jgi:hypothetical protein